jgi:hypothetical protein
MARIQRYTVSAYLAAGVGAALWAAPTLAADAAYCTAYADGASASLVESLNRDSTKQFIRDRLYTTCLNAEAQPALPRTIWALIDTVRPEAPPLACPVTTVTKVVAVVRAPEQALCTTAHMRTVYAGTSWRCAR